MENTSVKLRPGQEMKAGSILEHPDPSLPKLSSAMRAAQGIPASYNFDDSHPNIEMNLFGNDECGDCVIAARANHTLRLAFHQGMNIAAQEAIDEYIREEKELHNGEYKDWGLELSVSLANWKTEGWTAAGVTGRKIRDFLSLDPKDTNLFKTALANDIGIQIAISLPKHYNVVGNFGPGHDWTDTSKKSSFSHAILVIGYDQDFVIAITWGVYQRISWTFLATYCTAAYAVFGSAATLEAVKRRFDCGPS